MRLNPGDVVQHFKRELLPEEEKKTNRYLYKIVGFAKHSETMEDMVIYRELSGEHKIWAKPAYLFYEFVKVNGKLVPRFEKIV